MTLWENLLYDNSEKAEHEFPEYFSALAHFYPRFEDLTALWITNTSFSSIKHLTNYIFDESHYVFTKNYIRGNKKSTRNVDAYKKWLLSDTLIQTLTNSFYQYEKTVLAEKISWVLKMIEDEK